MAVSDITSYAATDFDLTEGQRAERKLLMTFVNAASFTNMTTYHSSPVWQLVGSGVEESSIEYNPTVNTVTDILGVTETTVDEFQMSRSLDLMTVKGGSKLHKKLVDIIERGAKSEFALFEVLIVRSHLKESDGETTPTYAFHAELHKGCTVYPTSEGGSAYIDMPITINYSGDKELGVATINDSTKVPTFTAFSVS